MQCPKCDSTLPDGSRFCAICGANVDRELPRHPVIRSDGGEPPGTTTQLVLSILVLLFCCQLLGVISLIFSILAMSKSGEGNFEEAELWVGRARTINIIGIGIWVVLILGLIVFMVFMGGLAAVTQGM
jgi:hypothetical protein